MEKEINRGRKKKEIDGEFAEILSQLLQEAKEKGISQDNIAQAIGVSRQSLGKWANGVTVPDILDLKKLAVYFNVSADYLLGLSENATTDIELKAVCDYTGLSGEAITSFINNMEELMQLYSPLDIPEFMYKIVDNILSSKNFYHIINCLFHLVPDSENVLLYSVITSERPDLSAAYYKVHSYSDACDLNRYKISRYLEQIVDLFDKRINKKTYRLKRDDIINNNDTIKAITITNEMIDYDIKHLEIETKENDTITDEDLPF